MVKDFSAWANAWNDYSRSDVNYLVFVVGGTAALVVLALSLLLESNGTVLTFFCGLAVIVTPSWHMGCELLPDLDGGFP